MLVTLLVLACMAAGAGLIWRGVGAGRAEVPVAQAVLGSRSPSPASPSPSADPSPSVSPSGPVLALAGAFPQSGPGAWVTGTGQGPVLGMAGTLRRFHVAVETGAPEEVEAFAALVDLTLGDPRSWIAGRQVRFQRVPATADADFTIHLATPETARRMCAGAGVDIQVGGTPYTSCRTFGRVIINLARWRLSVPEYVAAGVPLETYRQYVINHETGHELGYGHERCTGAGRVAPVMQTQTLGLRGCTPNPWPYLNGRRHSGPRE